MQDEHYNLASLLATTNLALHPGSSFSIYSLEMEQINIGGNKQACVFMLGESLIPLRQE